ncbi:MAG TPA: hypothetical protein VGM44_20925 [Polyangiaceae bacterium]|jgi:hypothetical protein
MSDLLAKPWGENMVRSFCVGCALLVSGCGSKTLSLDADGVVTPSADPSVVGSVHEDIGQLAVDDTRLYWLAVDRENGVANTNCTLRACDKLNCAASLRTIAPRKSFGALGFGVVGNEIYSFQALDGDFGASPSAALVATDLGTGVARTLATDVFHMNQFVYRGTAAYDTDAVYFSIPDPASAQNEIESISAPSGDSRNVVVMLGSEQIITIATHDDYLYWLQSPMQGLASLRRIIKKGTGTLELLADGLEVTKLPDQFGPFSALAFDENDVYWAENTLSGSIDRCPLSGCSGAPEVLAAPVRAPTAIAIDSVQAHYLYELDAFSYAIAECDAGGCEPSVPSITGVDGANLLALDGDALYTATTSRNLNPNAHQASPMAEIRRFAK